METYIIRNKTGMLACNALKYIELIMAGGLKRMPSGVEQYAHFTRFDDYIVTSKKNKDGAYIFTITKAK